MLAELDVLVFLKSTDELARVAERVSGALHTPFTAATMDEPEGVPFYEATGLGFRASLYANADELLDLEFEDFAYALEITSEFWCVELDTLDLEKSLSEYYARLLAFDLNLETATEIFLDTTEEAEVFEIRAFRPNPQFRLDQGPTTPKVYVVESREVERPFDEEEWDEEQEELDAGELEDEELDGDRAFVEEDEDSPT